MGGVLFTKPQSVRIGRVVRRVESMPIPRTRTQRSNYHSFIPPPIFADGIITESTLERPNFWRYRVLEAVWLVTERKWIVLEHGRVFEACYNDLEAHNNGVGQEGVGGTVGVVGNSNRVLLPIMNSCHVLLRLVNGVRDASGTSHKTSWNFELPNPFDVGCTQGAGR